MKDIKNSEKKLTIHMNNGDEYHITENEEFDECIHYGIQKIYELFVDYIVNKKVTIITVANDGLNIKYISRFAIYDIEKVGLLVKSISSIELVEENQNVKRREV